MPYNTRRKSLSLPSLGIQLPNASRAHRSNSKSSPHPETSLPSRPLTKRVKRSHDENEPPSPISSPSSKVGSPEIVDARPQSRPGPSQHTPPPSPKLAAAVRKIDTDGINDDIVIAVIEQLEKTGNRPHLIRELAAVLAATNDNVAQYVGEAAYTFDSLTNIRRLLSRSANPAALLSSRLSLYLKRPWTALSPCPLAKELIPVHPRKVFFFLTTRPRQSLPENSDDILPPTINEIKRLTPSISDPSVVDDDDVDMDLQDRSRLSPSPEVDLYSPEINQDLPVSPPTPGESFSGRSSLNPDGTVERSSRPTRVPSPPLEADERGFTETATAVRARGMSLRDPSPGISSETDDQEAEAQEETPELRQRRDQELGYELFGHSHPEVIMQTHRFMTSPMIHPRHDQLGSTVTKMSLSIQIDDVEMEDSDREWKMMSPESIEVEELDTLFSGF